MLGLTRLTLSLIIYFPLYTPALQMHKTNHHGHAWFPLVRRHQVILFVPHHPSWSIVINLACPFMPTLLDKLSMSTGYKAHLSTGWADRTVWPVLMEGRLVPVLDVQLRQNENETSGGPHTHIVISHKPCKIFHA
jgi:hypothetical protein